MASIMSIENFMTYSEEVFELCESTKKESESKMLIRS